MNPAEITLAEVEAAILLKKRRKIDQFFPDEGPLRRELYAKHIEFMAASARYSELMFCSANRVGKTLVGAYMTTCHSTGIYPDWWEGKRWKNPIQSWVANTTWETVRDINQHELVGPPERQDLWGTGMIPYDSIVDIDRGGAMKNGILLVKIRYRDSASETSVLQFKNYEQGRTSFQGTAKQLIWADEEVPADVYEEMLLRTMTCNGQIVLTYTPILGMTPLTQSFIEGPQQRA